MCFHTKGISDWKQRGAITGRDFWMAFTHLEYIHYITNKQHITWNVATNTFLYGGTVKKLALWRVYCLDEEPLGMNGGGPFGDPTIFLTVFNHYNGLDR